MDCGGLPDESEATISTGNTLKIEYLFLDENVCAPCGGTGQALAAAVDMLSEPLASFGVVLDVAKIHVADRKTAEAEKFLSSPTIRVNGEDIDPARTEDDCPTCGTWAGDATAVSCRNWHWRGKVYHAAPVGRIVEAIVEAALRASKPEGACCAETCCGDAESDEDYALPENLKGFFAARESTAQFGC